MSPRPNPTKHRWDLTPQQARALQQELREQVRLEALARLKSKPDVLIVDGHGLAHPRRFGIACHLGVLSGIPAIGCAKSILVGTVGELGESPGSTAELRAGDEVLGLALRTRENAKPVYLSIGHRVDLDSALALILSCIRGFRLPEPAQMAHQLVTQFRKESVQDDQDSSPPS